MKLRVRRTLALTAEYREEAGRPADVPLRKTAAIAVVENPFAGRYVGDLTPGIEASVEVGREMARMARAAFGPGEMQSYGKGGIVGVAGEQEHANALLTTAFADPVRQMMGGARAWISSVTKMGGPGTPIDVPMNHKDDVYVRSHYDAMPIVVPDSPMPDEIVLIVCVANRGRLNARVGGLSHDEATIRLRQTGV